MFCRCHVLSLPCRLSKNEWNSVMRIVPTGLLSTFVLCAAINPGWCPEPANLGMPIGASTGATMAAPLDTSPHVVPWEFDPRNPENMTRSQRLQMVGRERAAGRLQTDQELKNFLATGNPGKSYTPPEQKPLVKPASMSDAKWQELLKTRPKPPDYVSGVLLRVPPLTMEENAKLHGGTLTDLPGAVLIPPPAKATTTTPPERYKPVTKLGVHPTQTENYKPVTKLGVHPTQVQPTTRVFTSAAVDRLGSSRGATGGSKTTTRAGAAVLEKAHSPAPTMTALDRMTGVSNSGAGNTGTKSNTRLGAGSLNAPQMAPRGYIAPPAQRSQDTFRQPK
jgi:hypothetical protein